MYPSVLLAFFGIEPNSLYQYVLFKNHLLAFDVAVANTLTDCVCYSLFVRKRKHIAHEGEYI